MKKLIATLLLLSLVVSLRAHSGDWLTDFEAAKKKAAAENKPILALFTGSDWCPACIKWEKDTFSKPEFQDFAKEKVVLLLVDFPEKKPLPKDQKKANEALMRKYNIEEYPTVLMLDSKGKKIGKRITYTEGGPNVLLGKIGSTLEGKVDKKQ